jgi:hypothetical protein
MTVFKSPPVSKRRIVRRGGAGSMQKGAVKKMDLDMHPVL